MPRRTLTKIPSLKPYLMEGGEVNLDKVADVFASYFDRKIRRILEALAMDDVYNAKRLVNSTHKMVHKRV
jgi:hypothetical protein